jgi:ribosomal-protein-serine acetyltransferase
VLRPWAAADAHALVSAIEEAEIHRWLDGLPDPYTLDDAYAFLADARGAWTEATGAPFAITKDGAPVGGIGLGIDPRVPALGEVGYWVAAPVRRSGVATAAVKAVVDWAFDVVGVRRIELHAAVANVGSRKVAERAGFEQEGIKKSWRAIRGEATDFALYARVATGVPR